MNIIVNEELQAYIDPLTPDEHEALERSILTEGCRDALVLWGEVLVDGHNRYGICQKHGLPFQTVQHPFFKSMDDVHLWMIDQHLGRRSVSDFQRGVLALRKREILTERQARKVAGTGEEAQAGAEASAPWGAAADARVPEPEPLKSRADIARAARLSNSQVVMIEKIQKQAAPELVAAIKAGDISINAAAAVATLPAEEQKSAALGGKDELKQAAKRVRGDKRKAAPAEVSTGSDEGAVPPADQAAVAKTGGHDPLQILKDRVIELSAENEALHRQVAELKAQLAQAMAG